MTLYRLLSIATGVVPVLLFFGIAAGIKMYRYLEPKYRYMIIYLTICLTIDLVSRAVGELYGNNLIFIVVFSLLELLFFYIYYAVFLLKRKIMTFGVITAAACLYILFEAFILKDISPKEFQPYSKVICSFIIILMAINCFFEQLNEEQQDNVTLKQNSAFIIYFSLNLIFFLPVNFLINVASSVKFFFWCTNFLLTVSFYIFLSREIWKNGLTRKQLQSGS